MKILLLCVLGNQIFVLGTTLGILYMNLAVCDLMVTFAAVQYILTFILQYGYFLFPSVSVKIFRSDKEVRNH